ncbi:MAG TPA: HAD family hydrolase [Candidatus Aminicenantes bacterium]|nr:HAD family hydrolase [Candidatus Aminicenantes bacterium]
MNWKTILLDLDGTLTDPAQGIVRSVLYALEKLGITEPEPGGLVDFIGPPLHQSFARRYGFSRKQAFHAVALYREYFSERGIFENRLYAGIDGLLAGLARRGACLVLATAKPTVYACRILEYFQLAGFFSVVQGSELDGRRTRKLEVVRDALKRVPPGPAVMVGDRGSDIRGARANDISAVGVTWGYARPGELDAAAPDHIVSSIAQLNSLLEGG